ncbi:MAG: T9SS type A sorting domain-containing protein [Bacteroidaceae bacterium]|nr:T9SS type A sorting domain-containing protein [Bacteroidaceae bacterium]
MRKKYYPMIAVALMMSLATLSKADLAIKIHSYDTEAQPVEFALSEISKVQFGTGNFSVLLSEGEAGGSFDFRNVSKISFGEVSAVETVDRDAVMVVTPNPVRNILVLNGGQSLYGSEMNLYSVTGMHVLRVATWQGESIDVSHLPAGVYVINIQSETIKFVKL